MTTAEKLSINELRTCLESSVTRELANEITEQYRASHAQYLKITLNLIKLTGRVLRLTYFIFSIKPSIENTIPRMLR